MDPGAEERWEAVRWWPYDNLVVAVRAHAAGRGCGMQEWLRWPGTTERRGLWRSAMRRKQGERSWTNYGGGSLEGGRATKRPDSHKGTVRWRRPPQARSVQVT